MKTINLMLSLVLAQVLVTAPVNAHDEAPHYDRVHLDAMASSQVDNDMVIAILYAEAEGTDAARLSNEVNEKIRWALQQLEKHKSIKTQTQSYNTSPVYRNSKVWGWRVRQSIRLESRDMVLMSQQLGELQQKLALQGMHFEVSSQRRNQVDDELIKQAMQAFEQRARLVSGQLGRKAYRIVDINIATSGRPVRHNQYFAREMTSVARTAPAVEAGEQTLEVTVSGEIELE